MDNEVKNLMLKELKNNPSVASSVLDYMKGNQKINAIKVLKELGRKYSQYGFGLKDSKEFIESYMFNNFVSENAFFNDIQSKKTKKNKEFSELDRVDIKQISTKALMEFRKKLNKELKSRGKKL
jgi:arginine utilization protein RocB